MKPTTLFVRIRAFLKATAIRFNTTGPVYWKTLRTIFAWIYRVSIPLSELFQKVVIAFTGYGLDIPHELQVAANYVALIGLVGNGVAQLPVLKEAMPESDKAYLEYLEQKALQSEDKTTETQKAG